MYCKRAYGLGSQCRPNDSGSGKPWGVGILGRGGARWARWGKCKGQFMSNPRKRWKDHITARRVPSKWKGEQRGTKGNKGEQGEQGDHRVHNPSILCIYRNECSNE